MISRALFFYPYKYLYRYKDVHPERGTLSAVHFLYRETKKEEMLCIQQQM